MEKPERPFEIFLDLSHDNPILEGAKGILAVDFDYGCLSCKSFDTENFICLKGIAEKYQKFSHIFCSTYECRNPGGYHKIAGFCFRKGAIIMAGSPHNNKYLAWRRKVEEGIEILEKIEHPQKSSGEVKKLRRAFRKLGFRLREERRRNKNDL